MTKEEIEVRKYFLGYSGEGGFLPNLIDFNTMTFKDNNRMEGAAELITLYSGSTDSVVIEYNKESKYIISIFGDMFITDVNEAVEYEGAKVYIGQFQSYEVTIIEKTTTEAYIKNPFKEVRGTIIECNDLMELKNIEGVDLKGKEIVSVSGDRFNYSKVLITEEGDVAAVYSEDGLKGWYLNTTSELDKKVTVILESDNYAPMAFNLTDEEKAEIDALIEKMENPS